MQQVAACWSSFSIFHQTPCQNDASRSTDQAYRISGTLPKKQDLGKVAGLGVCLWLNQLLYILGIDMSGVVVATCMQPTIPVFTAMIAVALKLETGSVQKFAGIGIAVGGSLCMVRLPPTMIVTILCPLYRAFGCYQSCAGIDAGCLLCYCLLSSNWLLGAGQIHDPRISSDDLIY